MMQDNDSAVTTVSGPSNGVGKGFALALNPQDAAEAMKCADWMSKSSLVPKAYANKPHDIVIAAAMGARLGLDPFSALAGIAVVNGRPTLWGDAMLAVCQQRPDWMGMTVEWTEDGADYPDLMNCTVTITRKGSDPYAGHFSVADAKRASLWGKQGPWTQYPRRMLELRARSFALRGAYADALAGFHAREEMEDAIEVEATVVNSTSTPEPAARRNIEDAFIDPPTAELPPSDQQQDTVKGSEPAQDQPAQEAAKEPAEEQAPSSDAITAADLNAAVKKAVKDLGGQSKATPVLGPVATELGLKKFSDADPADYGKVINAITAAVATAKGGDK